MMVTFVSQCNKKALNRTRRVLDAYANRIGTNTWQTEITQDGLLAVKKSLRKTATKNTAVSCHWLRSRSRSQFIWVVGAKRRFNQEGFVPVNTTLNEVVMDIQTPKPVKNVIYANTHLQRLDHHLFAVGTAAQLLYRHFYPDKKNQADAAFIAGCMHDIGKIDPCFQKWVCNPKKLPLSLDDGYHIDSTKFNFEKHPRHNEISALIFQCIGDNIIGIKPIKKSIQHAIYWHHAKPFRKKSKTQFETYGQIYATLNNSLKIGTWQLITEQSIAMLEAVCKLDCEYQSQPQSILAKAFNAQTDSQVLENYEHTPLPAYKDYSLSDDLSHYSQSHKKNAGNNEIRACVITADRWISALPAKALEQHIEQRTLEAFITNQLQELVHVESDLASQIHECVAQFPNSERSQKQAEVAQKLAEDDSHVKVLAGAAGCGKTKIALEWAELQHAQQIIWVCPRVQICLGMFTELRASQNPYLPQANVELFTGEYKCTNSYNNTTPPEEHFTGDIVITTIDQLLSSVISHTKADRLLNYLSAHIVFDEYHEYISMPAFNLLFAELISSREGLKNGCNALLVSATPHYSYLEDVLRVDPEYDIVEMASFNLTKYKFNFLKYDESQHNATNPLYKKQPPNSFVISNTAVTAQKSFIHNLGQENAILLHSKFKKSDKKQLFNTVLEAFSNEGSRAFDVLRSGPIVQASLNITCDHMVSEITTAENCLQRMGRLDRFGKSHITNIYDIAVPETFDQNSRGPLARFLRETNQLESAKAWYATLIEHTETGTKELTVAQIYLIYKTFYRNTASKQAVADDMLAAMKKSVTVITAKVSEPLTNAKQKDPTKKRTKLANNSLRGDNRFVQMAVCLFEANSAPKYLEEYAYPITTNEQNELDNLTAAVGLIEGYGASEKNLLGHMAKKHHNIMGGTKPYRDYILLNDAKDPEQPIYLSYTPNDLLPIGGETQRHAYALYYAVCEQQAIGLISMNYLTQQKD